MNQPGYSYLACCANADAVATVQPLVHLCLMPCPYIFPSHVKWVTRWSQGRANAPMLAAMTVETTWSDPN